MCTYMACRPGKAPSSEFPVPPLEGDGFFTSARRTAGFCERAIKRVARHPAAKRDGRWKAAYASQRTITIPRDLQAALVARPRAREFFQALDSKDRYAILYRLQDAKQAETRQRRLQKFIHLLPPNKRLKLPARVGLLNDTFFFSAPQLERGPLGGVFMVVHARRD